MADVVVIVVNPLRAFTDELGTEFYACPMCDFQRIPHQQRRDGYDYDATPDQITAKYCPGCGRPLRWAESVIRLFDKPQ